MAYLDVAASLNAGRSQILIKAVNVHFTHALDVTIEVRGQQVDPSGEMFLLCADSPSTPNSFRTPDAVAIRKSDITAGPKFQMTLPRQSIAVLRLKASPQR